MVNFGKVFISKANADTLDEILQTDLSLTRQKKDKEDGKGVLSSTRVSN